MKSVALDVKRDLEIRFGGAVQAAAERVLRGTASRVTADEQGRFKERMATCTLTFFGDDWIATATLLFPKDALDAWLRASSEAPAQKKIDGREIADVLGELATETALGFGASFFSEDDLVVGPPTIVLGDLAAVVFPWSAAVEARLSFTCDVGPFWAVLRLDGVKG